MNMKAREFALQARINAQTLDAWLEAGWLTPHRTDKGTHYSEIDLARAHLIEDLKDLGINDEGVPVILDLVDQLHGLRRVLRELLLTIKAQPSEPGRT
jgi:chaperone modulatory protein CbpM